MMSETTRASRRKFLKIGTSMILAAGAPSLHANTRFKRKSPASRNLLEVGIILGSGSHSDTTWRRFLNPPEGEIRRTGMIFTKVWSVKHEVAEQFSADTGAEIVKSFDSMVDKVDGVYVDDYNAVAYNYKLARPYLDAGMPVFVNRPFADSIEKADEMIQRSRKNGASLMTASSYEFLPAVYIVKRHVKLDEITGYDAYNMCSDYYSHGIHGIWWAYATAGGGIEAVSLKCENWRKSCGSVTSVLYKDRGAGPFIGRIHEGYTSRVTSCQCAIDFQPGDDIYYNRAGIEPSTDRFLWLPMQLSIQQMFETGVMPQSHEEIMEKAKLFIGAFYSSFERDGNLIEFNDIPGSWTIGSPDNANSHGEIEMYGKLFGKEPDIRK